MPPTDATIFPAPHCLTVGTGARIVVLPTRESAGKGPPPGVTDGPAGVVALQLWIAGGTAAERPDEHGCAHLLEHMLFKPGPDGRDLASAVESLGGDVNAFTSHDETVVHVTVPAGHEHAALEALLEPVLRPRFDPKALALEAQVVVEEIRQYRDDPGAMGMQGLHEALFGRHPYGRPVLGSEAEVLGHDVARLRRFHRRVYAARRTSLVVVGPVDVAAVCRQARPWLEALPRGRAVDDGAEVTEVLPRARIRVREADVREAHVQLAWRGPPMPSPEACALEVASIVLGYGDASRLTRRVRRGSQLVSDIHASIYPSRRASVLLVAGHAEPRQVRSAVAGVLAEVEGLCRAPLEAEELERARAVLASDLIYRRETAQGHAQALGQNLSLVGSLDLDVRYHEVLEQLDAASVRRICNTWLRTGSVAISVVVPRGQAARTRALRHGLAQLVRGRTRATRTTELRRDRHGVVAATLPGGLRLLAQVDHRVPMAAGWVLWPGGLRREDARRHGATSMLASLVTRGCEAIDGDDLANEIEGQAAALDGFSSRSTAGLHFECMAGSVPRVLRRAIESALAPTFAEHELDEARRVALQEYLAEQDDPAKVAFRLALERLYRGHPFRWRRHGTPATLARLSSGGLRRAWAQWYPLGRAVLAISGDVDVDGIVGVLEGLLEDPTPPESAPPWSGHAPQYPTRPVELCRNLDREQSHLVIASPGLPFADRSSPTLDVLLAVLGGQAGRLFMALREAEGLVYHVSGSSTEGVDAGDVLFYAASSPDRMPRARTALEAELQRVCDELVGDEELSRAKALLVGQHSMSMERHGRVAFQLAFNDAFGLGRHDHLRYRSRVERVGPRSLRDLARRMLDPSRRVVVIVGP